MSRGRPLPAEADVIDLRHFFNEERRAVRTPRTSVDPGNGSAVLLSLRQHLVFHGSLEIHGRSAARARNALLPSREWDHAATEVRALLEREFGNLRVHRVRDAFIIRHYDHEELVAGILRVQFFARRVALPGQFSDGETARGSRVLLNWGVGTTRIEAESERLRRRQQRQTRK
ncbi:MAG: hypothetical protein CSB44_11940 [Gammaproteobacteria bacterium]|nr:MAG: hypothetical protein CSB44_11940 [Gammaproteobacteria bacterium]